MDILCSTYVTICITCSWFYRGFIRFQWSADSDVVGPDAILMVSIAAAV